MLDAAGLAIEFLHTQDWAQARQFAREHPEVLGEDVDQAMAELERRLDEEGDAPGRDGIRWARAALAACRRDGLELGFANAELERAQRQLAEAGDQDRAGLLGHLGRAWHGRFEITGDVTDLNEAVEFARQAAEAAGPGDYAALGDLAGVEEVRFRRFGELGDLFQMADHQRAAVRAGRNAPRRDQCELQVRLAARVTLQAEVLMRLVDEKDIARLTAEAVQAAQAGLGLAEPHSRERLGGLAALVGALRMRYTRFGSLADLDAAVVAYEEIAGWPGASRAAEAYRDLAYSLHERSKRTSSPDDLRRAVKALSSWLAVTPLDAPDRAAAVADLERWQDQLAAPGR